MLALVKVSSRCFKFRHFSNSIQRIYHIKRCTDWAWWTAYSKVFSVYRSDILVCGSFFPFTFITHLPRNEY